MALPFGDHRNTSTRRSHSDSAFFILLWDHFKLKVESIGIIGTGIGAQIE